MFGFTIHINLQSKLNSKYSLENHKTIIYKNISFNYLKFEKFENDKIFKENSNYIIGIDGVILNLTQLKNQYAISDYFKLIIHLFKKENISFVSNLKGEFSGFIFDKNSGKLLFFNNKTATKQVFYSEFDSSIIITPSIKNIIDYKKTKNLHSNLNINATYNLLTFSAMIENQTLIDNVFKLGAGEYLEIKNDYLKLTTYHTFNNIDYSINNKNKAIDLLNESFSEALKLEYQKDNEYNYKHLTTLSGGLDSRMTLMIADKLGFKNETFCFSLENYLDEKIARKIAKDLDLKFHFVPLNGEYIINLKEMVKVNNGLHQFLAAAHYNYAIKKIDLSNYGLIHTGQIGDGVLGTFVTKKKEYLSKRVSDKLSHKSIVSKNILNKYSNEEVFKLHQRVFNLTHFGSYVTEYHNTYLTSPFLDANFIEIALSIDPKLKYNQKIYLEWIQKYHPEIAKYKWERTGFKPNKNWKTPLSRYTNKVLKEYYNLTNQREKFSMTPTDHWIKKNIEIQEFYTTFFNNNIDLTHANKELFKDLNMLFHIGNTNEKAMVLTVLEVVRKFNLKV